MESLVKLDAASARSRYSSGTFILKLCRGTLYNVTLVRTSDGYHRNRFPVD